MPSQEYEIARSTFERLRRAFPTLMMTLDPDPENIDLALDIPAQPGLRFDVNLNLQADELHLEAGAFAVEWFPCTDPTVADGYFDAVSGLLSGRLRILEHQRGRRVVKAELQHPVASGWETIATWARLSLPWGQKTFNVVQNHAA